MDDTSEPRVPDASRTPPTPADGPSESAARDDVGTDDVGTEDVGTDDVGTDEAADATTDATTDAAVARVRAADPAAGAEPDTARLHAHLAEATGVTFGAGTPEPRDELVGRRARRRPARWLQVAALAAGVALVGGGGYAVGAAGDGRPAAPPIALQGAGGPAGATEMSASADAARLAMMPGWFGGRTVFRGDGLDGAAGSAGAWAFDASDAATAATAARVAEVLGVPGEPRLEWGQWVVGPQDGTSPTLQVGVDGQANMWFIDPAWDPSVACTSGEPRTFDGSASSSSDAASDAAEPAPAPGSPVPEPMPAPGTLLVPESVPAPEILPVPESVPAPELLPVPELMPELEAPQVPAPADPSVCDPASTPTGDAAIATARDLLDRLGVDVTDAELTVSDETGIAGLVNVTAAQVVDGTQTGAGWSVQLVGTGVQSLSGPLADLVELGTYDHISADQAVDRLNDPRFGASYGGVVPFAARTGGGDVGIMEEPAVAPTDDPTVPPVPAPGDPVAWPVQDVTLTGARLGVTLLTTPAGATLLVPAWELTDADGGTWSVVAVVEDQLDLRAP